MTALLILATLTGEVFAGDPIANPKTGRVILDGSYGISQRLERDSLCAGSACSANLDRRSLGLELSLAIIKGVGVYGFSSWTDDAIAEARLQSDAHLLGGGLRLGDPLNSSFWVVTDTRMTVGEGSSDKAGLVDDPGTTSEMMGSTRLMAAMGNPSDGGHAWFGAEVPWKYRSDLRPLGDAGVSVLMPMKPRLPVNVVLGGALISDRLGTPWGSAPRLRTTVELCVGYENALTVATGLSF